MKSILRKRETNGQRETYAEAQGETHARKCRERCTKTWRVSHTHRDGETHSDSDSDIGTNTDRAKRCWTHRLLRPFANVEVSFCALRVQLPVI